MKIAITGATGFIGSRLCEYLRRQGHQIEPVGRKLISDTEALREVVGRCDAVINLAGASIGKRWSEEYKRELYDSRVVTTQRVVRAINDTDRCKLLISASAVGYYPSTGCHDELSSKSGDGFLANLCAQWEQQAQRVKPSVRLVIARFGVVISMEGGAFKKMMMTSRVGVLMIPGRGNDSFSWIDREDLVRAMEFVIDNDSVEGILNFTAPEVLTLRQFILRFAEVRRCWLVISIPDFFLRALYGEAAGFFLNGHCVYPERLMESGFVFLSPDVAHFIAKH